MRSRLKCFRSRNFNVKDVARSGRKKHLFHFKKYEITFCLVTTVSNDSWRANMCRLPRRSFLPLLRGSACSGDCGLDLARGGGPLKPRPRNGEILPAANVGDGLLASGETGLESAMMTKLDRRCALEEDAADGASL